MGLMPALLATALCGRRLLHHKLDISLLRLEDNLHKLDSDLKDIKSFIPILTLLRSRIKDLGMRLTLVFTNCLIKSEPHGSRHTISNTWDLSIHARLQIATDLHPLASHPDEVLQLVYDRKPWKFLKVDKTLDMYISLHFLYLHLPKKCCSKLVDKIQVY